MASALGTMAGEGKVVALAGCACRPCGVAALMWSGARGTIVVASERRDERKGRGWAGFTGWAGWYLQGATTSYSFLGIYYTHRLLLVF